MYHPPTRNFDGREGGLRDALRSMPPAPLSASSFVRLATLLHLDATHTGYRGEVPRSARRGIWSDLRNEALAGQWRSTGNCAWTFAEGTITFDERTWTVTLTKE